MVWGVILGLSLWLTLMAMGITDLAVANASADPSSYDMISPSINNGNGTFEAAAVYEMETVKELREKLRFCQITWRVREPKAVRCFVRRFDETLVYREYQEPLKTLVKTTSPVERRLEEVQRRIKPFRKFISSLSVERIVYGSVVYVSYGSAGLDTQLDSYGSVGQKTHHFTQFALLDLRKEYRKSA